MVAHLVRLKLSLLRNGLRRSVPQLVGMVLAALYALGVVGLAVAGLVALRSTSDVGLARSVVVVLGSAVTLGWLVVPVLLGGVDQTLDPVRFATFAVPRRQLLAGLLAAALVGIPGVVVSVLALTTTITWSRSPQAVAVAVVAAVVGVLTCVTLSRVSTSGLSALGQSRRGREMASAAGGLLFVAAGLGSGWISEQASRPDLMGSAASVLGWTPFGLAWAAPADVAAGALGTGLVRVALAVLVLGLLLRLWDALLRRALENPRSVSARTGGRDVGAGWFARLPGTPTGAVAARSVTYWRRDARYVVAIGMMPLLPLVLLVPAAGGNQTWLLGMALLAGYLLGWGMHNDLAYDGTAFWLHVSTGAPGRADRLGRLAPTAVLGAVLVPGYAVLSSAVTGQWSMLPADLGAGAALLLSGFGVASVLSALKPYPVPAAGDSPFSSPPGAMGVTLLVQLVAGIAVTLLSAPVLGLWLVALGGAVWAGWAALVLALVLGPAYVLVGVRSGAGVYDRRAPDLLSDLARIR
jgi:ABC-2 type transport system permease protein